MPSSDPGLSMSTWLGCGADSHPPECRCTASRPCAEWFTDSRETHPRRPPCDAPTRLKDAPSRSVGLDPTRPVDLLGLVAAAWWPTRHGSGEWERSLADVTGP